MDSTNQNFNDKLVDYTPTSPSGYDEELAKHDTVEALCGIGARDFPDCYWIEPSEWKDVARMNDKYDTWPESWRNRFTHQGTTHSCTCQALAQNMEIAWNRQRQSKEDAVWFSPLSVYAEANPRRFGGSTMQRTLNICMTRGILPDSNGPAGPGTQKTKFSHTMHQDSSAGPWVPLSQFPTGWRNTARNFRPLEVINVSSWEQHVALVLNGICVSNGRYQHAIPHVQIVWRNGQLYSKYADSYNVHRYDSVPAIKAGVGGAYAICTTTIPHLWSDPAPSS